MLKNIEKTKEKGLEINPEYLKPELYSFQIPPHILKGLGLLAPGEKPPKRGASRQRSKRFNSQTSMSASQEQRSVNNKSAPLGSYKGDTAFDAYNSAQINLQMNDERSQDRDSVDSHLNRVNVKSSQYEMVQRSAQKPGKRPTSEN